MNNQLLIWGAGGHGKVVLDTARSTGKFELIVFLDEDTQRASRKYCECSLVGGVESLHRFVGSAFIIAVGDNRARARCFESALRNGLLPVALIHATAVVSPSASIGRGTVVMPRAVINANTVIGENCIINSGAIIEHDCIIGADSHISPGAILGGGVHVGRMSHVGIGAIVLPCGIVGEETVVGAGAVVLKQAPSHCTVVGVPAKEILQPIPSLL